MNPGILKSLLAIGGLALSASAAHAIPTVTVSVSGAGSQANPSTPATAESDFLESLDAGYIVETFKGFAGGARAVSLDTAAGQLTQVTAGGGGRCETLPGGCATGLAVLDAGTTVYDDRYALSGVKWLDNVGTRALSFTPIAGINSIGFFGIDMGDQVTATTFSIVVAGVTIDLGNILGAQGTNANARYLSFIASDDIDELLIYTNTHAEGYGIDNLAVGRVGGAGLASVAATSSVPEPGTMALLGLGLLGTRLVRRRPVA